MPACDCHRCDHCLQYLAAGSLPVFYYLMQGVLDGLVGSLGNLHQREHFVRCSFAQGKQVSRRSRVLLTLKLFPMIR